MDNTPLLVVPDTLLAENIFLAIGTKEILTGATIKVEKGCITGLLGRNGAGKSTILQAIFGTIHAQECDVFLNGVKIKRRYAAERLLNYLPQKPFLPHSVKLKHIAAQYNVDPNTILEYFPTLENELNKKVAEISGGTERLFSVLLLLFANTRFTLLDEPFTHIMPIHIERLKELLYKQKEKKGIIITDHLYHHLLDVSDKLYLLKEGRSVFIKDWDNLVLHGYVNELPAEHC